MADTTFVNESTVIEASWLNAINDFYYTLFNSATTVSGARTALGLGTIATQDANNVTITGGSIIGITDLAIADGGTGAGNATQARSNLGAQEDVITTRGDIVVGNSTPAPSRLAVGTSGQVVGTDGTDVSWKWQGVVQQVHSQIVEGSGASPGAVATGTTILPTDDTVPQITEGDEYMTVTITPKSASHILYIESIIVLSSSQNGGGLSAALFQDSTAGALAAVTEGYDIAARAVVLTLTHRMTAGTTSATTFRVRAGANGAGTTTFNGQTGSRLFGGVMASRITVTEMAI